MDGEVHITFCMKSNWGAVLQLETTMMALWIRCLGARNFIEFLMTPGRDLLS